MYELIVELFVVIARAFAQARQGKRYTKTFRRATTIAHKIARIYRARYDAYSKAQDEQYAIAFDNNGTHRMRIKALRKAKASGKEMEYCWEAYIHYHFHVVPCHWSLWDVAVDAPMHVPTKKRKAKYLPRPTPTEDPYDHMYVVHKRCMVKWSDHMDSPHTNSGTKHGHRWVRATRDHRAA